MKLAKDYQMAWMAKHPLYPTWQGMRRNCGIIKGASAYIRSLYAGIGMCKEWCESYSALENWALANGWKPGLLVARMDKSGSYCPENCIVTTQEKNVNMRRNTVRVDGMSLRDYIGVPSAGRGDRTYRLISDRYLKCRWDTMSALHMPKMNHSQSQGVQARLRKEIK